MAAKLTLRAMRRKDVPLACRMIKALGAHFGDNAKGNRHHLETYCFGPKKLSAVWLAFVDGAPAGFGISRDWINLTQGSKVRHVDFLFVEKRFRRTGVGDALLKMIKETAERDGCGLMDIGAALDNQAANKLYQKFGFKKRTKRTASYRMRLGK